jgi:hemolysin activation/secretion protein/AraC-like DNA-binding protein
VLKLEYFVVLPQYLNGLLTVAECRQLEDVSQQTVPRLLHFAATESSSQKFMRLVAQPQRDNLSTRSALLQLWASSISCLLPAHSATVTNGHTRERFREFVGKMAEAELAARSLPELAKELHCSERHFSRLFREEFKISLRSCQVELRLQRARQLLSASNTKIINVAYESGFRHLGLFNAMFKRRFGLTPSAWRGQNTPTPSLNTAARSSLGAFLILLLVQCCFAPLAYAQTTNAAPKGFKVKKYLVSGNSILPPEKIGALLTNTPAAFGTNVTFNDIRTALGDLQMAYRERGFVTVSVGLPPQKLTNDTVKINVTEGRLAAITVKGNNHFSTENVLRALPSLHTNMLLNSHVFQRELDKANANRDRQVYPVIGPGLEPGTSELTLKVKDRFPLHARVEMDNSGPPGTPENRVSFSTQYGNLWNHEHQIGLQYGFSPLDFSATKKYYFSPLDYPLVANYSAYYRLPLGRVRSLQQQVDTSNGHFGYNEITHQFQMPPPSGRPELTFYASRSRSDTGVQLGTATTVVSTPLLTIVSQDSGQNFVLNEGLGTKFTLPLPAVGRLSSSAVFGFDFKRYEQVSLNTNNFYATTYITNSDGTVNPIKSTVASPQPARFGEVQYFPLNVGFSGSLPDSGGTTFFNAQANYNLFSVGKISRVAYTTNAPDKYFSIQAGMSREQRLYKEWTVLLRADGQWARDPLLDNERFTMGGVAGVRGFSDGAAHGDAGWRMSVEPRTPMVNIGMVDGDIPFWVRGSVFVDYGQLFAFKPATGVPGQLDFMGAGFGMTANIGSHMDARLALAWPILNPFPKSVVNSFGGDGLHVYFAVGAQF